MLQVFRFPQPSGLKVVEISHLFPRTDGVSVNKMQASRCYECPPLTFRCPLTKFRAGGCALFQNESSDVVWSGTNGLFYIDFAEQSCLLPIYAKEHLKRW